MKSGRQGSRALKRAVFDLLKSHDFEESLRALRGWPARKVVNPLFSLFLSRDEEVRWRAITAMGSVVSELAQQNMESARVVMRRLMWMLNDESGGIGWGAPEAMGAIMAAHEGLAREYANVLISYVNEEGNFLEYEPLQRGAVWGVGRVAQERPGLVQDAIPHLLLALQSSDAGVRGLAAWAVGLLGAEQAAPLLKEMVLDNTALSLYLNGELMRCSIGGLAEEALARIDNA
jgi:hypothetical protein